MMKSDFRILVVDDEPELREAVKDLLSRNGYIVEQAVSGKDALVKTRNSPFHLVITDIVMPEMDGIALLKSLKQFDDELPVLMITGNSTVENAVEAIKIGAEDYISKPFDNAELLVIVKRLYENKLFKQRAQLWKQETLRKNVPAIVGESSQIRKVLSEIESVAGSDASVLILGESGTGKELVARSIHALSKRNKEPFVAINAAAVPQDLLESEFFGHEKGAFSGAVERKFGLFEIANGGTLFLDEIAEMPMDLQAKMLRTVESRKLRRLGGTQEIAVDIRIVSATNRNLKEHIREKQFREDLYFRLCTFCIEIPPLRQRKEDIPLLAHHYLNNRGYRHATLSEDVLEALQLYEWPGNVRELENALERALLLSRDQAPRLKHLPAEIQELFRRRSGKQTLTTQTLEEVEKEHILQVYESTGMDKVKTAKLLGIGLKTLYRKLKQFNTERS